MIQANFGVNSSKSRGPAKTISVFNFEVSHAELKFTEARMAQFQEKVIDFLSFAKRVKRYRSLDFVSEILNYAQSINRSQAVLLAQLALSERVYQNYLKQLDAESAVDALKSEALRRFDAFIKVAGNGEALRVCHVKFGRGTIVAVDGNKVLVNFDKNGHKLVLKSFLEKLT